MIKKNRAVDTNRYSLGTMTFHSDRKFPPEIAVKIRPAMVIIRGKDALTDGYVVHDGVMKQKGIWKDLLPGDFALTEALETSRSGPTY